MYSEVLHYPRLDTILLVEEAIRKSDRELTRTALYRVLQGRVMYQTLKVILDYLVKSNKITFAGNKIVWIFTNEKLDKAVAKGREYGSGVEGQRHSGVRLAVRRAEAIR